LRVFIPKREISKRKRVKIMARTSVVTAQDLRDMTDFTTASELATKAGLSAPRQCIEDTSKVCCPDRDCGDCVQNPANFQFATDDGRRARRI